MNISNFKGDWALVTGASSGIGEAFAWRLARSGMSVALVARRGELLDQLALAIERETGVRALPLAMDLTAPGQIGLLKARLESEGVRVRLLCNNAGRGRWGRFEDASQEDGEALIALNVAALASMCRHFYDHLASFPASALINVSSPAAYQPVPFMALYAASKSFVHQFSQALHGEWGPQGILVQTLVPGPTDTEFDALAGAYESALSGRGSAASVVEASIAGLVRGDPVASSAKGLYKQRLFAALFPARMVIREVAKMFRPPR